MSHFLKADPVCRGDVDSWLSDQSQREYPVTEGCGPGTSDGEVGTKKGVVHVLLMEKWGQRERPWGPLSMGVLGTQIYRCLGLGLQEHSVGTDSPVGQAQDTERPRCQP